MRRSVLRSISEERVAFKVGDSVEDLGVFLGPGAMERSWEAPLAKWKGRCRPSRSARSAL